MSRFVALEPKQDPKHRGWWYGAIERGNRGKHPCHYRKNPYDRGNGRAFGHGTHFSAEAARLCAERTARRWNRARGLA